MSRTPEGINPVLGVDFDRCQVPGSLYSSKNGKERRESAVSSKEKKKIKVEGVRSN